MNYNIVAYSIYIPVTLVLCIWIAKSLHKNTKVFLVEKFRNNEPLAIATNNLIQTGFYLISFGFSFMYMSFKNTVHHVKGTAVITNLLLNGQEMMERLATKVGVFTFVLGLILFFNFFIMLIIQAPKKQSSHFINE